MSKEQEQANLDINLEPDYWTKLHHQSVIAALQGILSNPEQIALDDIDCVAQAVRMANQLINKLKEDSQ